MQRAVHATYHATDDAAYHATCHAFNMPCNLTIDRALSFSSNSSMREAQLMQFWSLVFAPMWWSTIMRCHSPTIKSTACV